MANLKKDFIDVEVPTKRDAVLKEIRRLEAEYTKNHKPFDRKGAMNAFDDYCRTYELGFVRSVKDGVAPPSFNLDVDWSSFGDPDRFTLLGETDAYVQNAKTGFIMPTLLGVNKTYLAKSGSKITVFVPKPVETAVRGKS